MDAQFLARPHPSGTPLLRSWRHSLLPGQSRLGIDADREPTGFYGLSVTRRPRRPSIVLSRFRRRSPPTPPATSLGFIVTGNTALPAKRPGTHRRQRTGFWAAPSPWPTADVSVQYNSAPALSHDERHLCRRQSWKFRRRLLLAR